MRSQTSHCSVMRNHGQLYRWFVKLEPRNTISASHWPQALPRHNPQCPACAGRREHTVKEWRKFHSRKDDKPSNA